MKRRILKYGLVALPLLLGVLLSMTSCDRVWHWLWDREAVDTIHQSHLILDVGEVDASVIYTGEAHSGTDIYYVGEKGNPNRDRIIVIDPGHQEKGSSAQEPIGPGAEITKAEVSQGATGVSTGQLEYELNLAVALLLRDELIRRGYSVVMIRETNEVSISNMERAEIANKYETAAYIRIHANSWTDDTMRGAMTICQSPNNPYPTCVAHYERSRVLSEIVLDRFCEETGISKLNVREMDDMTGTNWSRFPTTILEMGFLSNKSDDSIMDTEYFRQEAAMGIANGLDAYFAWLETQLPEWETLVPVTTESVTQKDGQSQTEPFIENTEVTTRGEEPTEPPIEETSSVETSVEETPVEETPVEETPVEETPVEETSVEETLEEVAPSEEISTEGETVAEPIASS